MTISFSKMHGLGNDFMVINNLEQNIDLAPMRIQQWADRNWGVGFDQLLVVEPPQTANAQFSYRIFNADGSEVEHCGNGARCFARFVHNHQLTQLRTITVDTIKDQLVLEMGENGYVTVNMGVPSFVPSDLPMMQEENADNQYKIFLEGLDEPVHFAAVAIGNPHAVIMVENVHAAPVEQIGEAMMVNDLFPKGVNVGFQEVIDKRNFNLRVYERGVGETQACGSGACAAAVAGMRAGRLGDTVSAHLTGGMLEISWAGEGKPIYMRGPAVEVYRGQLSN